MSKSKFIMAQKLHNVQQNLMGEPISDFSLEGLISLIFKACLKENLCFWFSVVENDVVLNLRDVSHENHELNIRQHYELAPLDAHLEELKKQVLINAFLITKEKIVIENKVVSSETKEDEPSEATSNIISSSKPVPPHVNEVIKIIEKKGVPVTPESINNHLPWKSMGANARIKCERFLKEMEASQ